MTQGSADPFNLSVFLSHRTALWEANVGLFQTFKEAGGSVSFRVDEGLPFTSVTRLESMINQADAFVGFMLASPGADDLSRESRYARLELDIAVRARKPILMFVESRLSGYFRTPPGALRQEIDPVDLVSAGSAAHRQRVRLAEEFVILVKATNAARAESALRKSDTVVPILLSPAQYSKEAVDAVATAVERHHRRRPHRVVETPTVLDQTLQTDLERAEVAIVDLHDENAGIAGYLHGRAIPTIRLARVDDGEDGVVKRSLLDGQDTGYQKDVVRWSAVDELHDAVAERLHLMDLPPQKAIVTSEDAHAYFLYFKPRDEAIFVSYAGEDLEDASKIIKALGKRFSNVFDYKDGESIPAGMNWRDVIRERVDSSHGGVVLLSKWSAEKEYCIVEADRLRAAGVPLVPVKLRDEEVGQLADLPELQYVKLFEPGRDAKAVVAQLEALLDAPREHRAHTPV